MHRRSGPEQHEECIHEVKWQLKTRYQSPGRARMAFKGKAWSGVSDPRRVRRMFMKRKNFLVWGASPSRMRMDST